MNMHAAIAVPAVDVLFVSMPWATTTRPSIALGILDRLCAEAETSCASIFPNLDLVARMGIEAATPMSDERALYGLGEHLFAVDIFGRDRLASDTFLDLMCRLTLPAPFADRAYVAGLRDETIPRFLDETVDRILAANPAVVGFTATFNQVMASLAVAVRIKARRPDIVVIAGGACFDGEMGQECHRVLPHAIDHVFMGEAEESFRAFLDRRKSGAPTTGIPGVTWYEDGAVRLLPGGALMDMDRSPMPNYFPYFDEAARIAGETGTTFEIDALPFEGSRGCWWGQKNHCLFCGINKDLLKFREKTPERVVDEIMVLAHLHGVAKLTATDWIISRKSRVRIFELMRDQDLDLELFYETRSDLDKWEVALMKEAGALRVQPGIESFSTPVLKLMRKGTTALRQVRFLKWAREYGVKLSYNILCGFPGDETRWYLDMIELIETIPHLQPPTSNANFIELHRFSPLFDNRQAFGIDRYELRVDYRFNFPDGMVDPYKIGYFFEYECDRISDPSRYMDRLRAAIAPWVENWEKRSLPRCDYLIGPGFVQVTDTRGGQAMTTVLRGLAQDVFLLLDDIGTRHGLTEALHAKYPEQVAAGMVDAVVDDLIAKRLVIAEDQTLLALPVAVTPRPTPDLRRYVLGDGDVDVVGEELLEAAQ